VEGAALRDDPKDGDADCDIDRVVREGAGVDAEAVVEEEEEARRAPEAVVVVREAPRDDSEEARLHRVHDDFLPDVARDVGIHTRLQKEALRHHEVLTDILQVLEDMRSEVPRHRIFLDDCLPDHVHRRCFLTVVDATHSLEDVSHSLVDCIVDGYVLDVTTSRRSRGSPDISSSVSFRRSSVQGASFAAHVPVSPAMTGTVVGRLGYTRTDDLWWGRGEEPCGPDAGCGRRVVQHAGDRVVRRQRERRRRKRRR
jgi:hypothetical protein